MVPHRIMILAGEASGDALAAELVAELRTTLSRFDNRGASDAQPLSTSLAPRFFGAGGPRLAAAGVDILLDLASHAVFGLSEVLQQVQKFRGFFQLLLRAAAERQPDLIILVDYAGFNRRFAAAVRRLVARRHGPFQNWNPRIVYYVSPQVWASRQGRARQLARDVDLLLSIFPFEREWYARHTPGFPVEFVGHPIVDRHGPQNARPLPGPDNPARVLLLPGSRGQEIRRHLPVMLAAADLIRNQRATTFRIVAPNDAIADLVRSLLARRSDIAVGVGSLADALRESDLAIASSGTVTVECAWFRVPTVVLYKLSWPTFQIARRIIRVRHIAMPNLLADQRIFPELIQHDATADNLAREALALLSPDRHHQVQQALEPVLASLGDRGAAQRAAVAISRLLQQSPSQC